MYSKKKNPFFVTSFFSATLNRNNSIKRNVVIDGRSLETDQFFSDLKFISN